MNEVDPEAILKKLGIESFERSGRLAFCCPFHDDNDPSAGFYRDTGLAHCFSCEYTLDAIQFYAKFHGQKRGDAIRDLEKQFGPLTDRKTYIDRNLLALMRARGERKLGRLKEKLTREVHGALGETLDRILLAYEREQIVVDQLQTAMDRWNDKTKDLTKDHQYGIIEEKETVHARPDIGGNAETGADARLEESPRDIPGAGHEADEFDLD